MDWNKGFTAQYYAAFVDPYTWVDLERFEITAGRIQRNDSGLICSADLTCKDYDQTTERWVRIWMDAFQSGTSEHIPLFTGLAIAPERDMDGRSVSHPLTCYSVLKSAQDIFLPLGYYVSAGANGAQLVKQLLSAGTPAPITISGNSPTLSQYIIAEDNENNLSMAEKILTAINWRLRVRGDGSVVICGPAQEASARFDPSENDSIEPQLKAINDWYSCPNVFRAVMGDAVAIARDDSPNSPLSTVNRGREVWAEERDCNLSDTETLAEYAQRRLRELQRHYLSVSYTRRFHPDVLASDLVSLHYPEQRLEGLFYVSSQSITLGHGAQTGEEVIQV